MDDQSGDRPTLAHVADWFARKIDQVEANPNFESDPDAERNHYAYTLAQSVVQLAIDYPDRWMQVYDRAHGRRLDEPDVPLTGAEVSRG